MPVKFSEDQRQMLVNEWREQIGDLLDEVEGWAQAQGLNVKRTETSILGDRLPGYTTQMLDIHIGDEKRVYLEPIARFTLNGRGVVELYGWPSMRRVRLQPANGSGNGETWVVMTDSGIPLRQGWNCKNFVTLVADLVAE